MKYFAYEKIFDFDNIYAAYKASRRSKRRTREVVKFELNPGPNLCALRQELHSGTYRLSGYYHFTIHDPKTREIYALHYRDRILQHSLCDNVLAPYFETHLIYDNAACRKDKGTFFAMNRLKTNSKTRWHHRLRKLRSLYAAGCIEVRKLWESLNSFQNHLSYGNTHVLYTGTMSRYVLCRGIS